MVILSPLLDANSLEERFESSSQFFSPLLDGNCKGALEQVVGQNDLPDPLKFVMDLYVSFYQDSESVVESVSEGSPL